MLVFCSAATQTLGRPGGELAAGREFSDAAMRGRAGHVEIRLEYDLGKSLR